MSKGLSVVLTSGGLNSAVMAALEAQDNRLALLHIQYGQQAMEPELRAFEALCDWLDPQERQIVTLGDWPQLTASTILDGRDIEDAGALNPFAPATTFVPMLAPIMVCVAAAWTQKLGAARVAWGVGADNPGHYPDRSDAVRLLTWQLVSQSLGDRLARTIEAPLAQYTRQAIWALATQLQVPIDVTWSCLRGGYDPCGRCVGCASRKAAIGQAKTTAQSRP
jgi:7-cyano-7-deazaguanine synthase